MSFLKRAVGQPIDRVDGRGKVLGRAMFAADHRIPDLAYAVVVQSEMPHGSVNTSGLDAVIKGASHAPGVLYILSSENCPAIKELPSELTDDLPFERRPPLSDTSVQHVGQHLAVVVGESIENAMHAASLLHFDYEPEPAILSALQVTDASGTASLGEGRVRQGSYLPDHSVKLTQEKLQDTRGHADPTAEAFRKAQTYRTPVPHHNPIELSSTIASWNGDHLTIYESTRWIVGSRKTIASYLDMPEANVRIICPYVGGSFGSKSFLWQHVVLVAIAARAVGRPIKLVLTLPQMFTSVGHRPATIQEVVLAAVGDGRLTTTEHHTLTETSTVTHFTEPAGLSSRILYRSPHLAVSHRVARINLPTPCFMRGPGEAPGLFALEIAMDELACSLEVDPVKLRVRNHADIDQASGMQWSSNHLLECYEDASSRFGWHERVPTPRAMRRNGLQIGWGMATATYPGRRMPAGCRTTLSDTIWAEDTFVTHKTPVGCGASLTVEGSPAFLPQRTKLGTESAL